MAELFKRLSFSSPGIPEESIHECHKVSFFVEIEFLYLPEHFVGDFAESRHDCLVHWLIYGDAECVRYFFAVWMEDTASPHSYLPINHLPVTSCFLGTSGDVDVPKRSAISIA